MKLKRELPMLAFVVVPIIYLAYIWNSLPERVPLHWNIIGEIDRYGSKVELLILAIALPLVMYVVFLIIPKLDPKNKLIKMGNKFHSIRFLLTALMSIVAFYLIYSAKNQLLTNLNIIVLLMGVMYIILGNYFKTIKANYFLGIRTPWTLENETVWKETHHLAGKVWFLGGLLIVFMSLILSEKVNFISFMIITVLITVIPVVYSYRIFKSKEQASA